MNGFQEIETAATEEAKKSNHVKRKIEKRQQDRKLDPHVEEQFGSGRLLAAISSRPGQCGRADGYVLSSEYFLSLSRHEPCSIISILQLFRLLFELDLVVVLRTFFIGDHWGTS